VSESAIVKLITKHFKHKALYFWFAVRVVSIAGPLINTYVFSQGIDALETGKPLLLAIKIFAIFLGILLIENTIRLVSKNRIAVFVEEILIDVQEELLEDLKPLEHIRKETIQSVRNLTDAVHFFATFIRNTGVNGFVNFFSVPVILFFIDKRVFALEIVLIGVYLITTFFFSKIYEKHFETFDKAKEYYFSKMLVSNRIEPQAVYIRKSIRGVENIHMYEWLTAQNMIAIFQFMVVSMIAVDIFSGAKQISDLVLIVGYTNQSQTFLNSVTNFVEYLMQVKAGVERLEEVSHKK